MGRWQPDARERLEQAALDLFTEQGFAATTVPQIAARAGLTTRTFFRHFADKREVIFAGEELPQLAARLLADAPAGLEPWALVLTGLRTVAETRFEGRREEFRRRWAVVASDDSLRERDLRKRAAVAAAVRAGLVERGLDAVAAALLAETAGTVLQVALERWLAVGEERPLAEVIEETASTLVASLGPSSREATDRDR